jgi:hypothetical protein
MWTTQGPADFIKWLADELRRKMHNGSYSYLFEVVVVALGYKPEGCGLDYRWGY